MKSYVKSSMLISLIWIAGSVFAQTPNSAYVVNSVGENLSIINLENQTINADAATLGLFANQVNIHGNNAYVVNSGLNEIQVIDLATLNTIRRIDTGQGTNPWAIEFINDTLAAVSLLLTNEVAFFNVTNGLSVETVAVGAGPEGMKYHNGTLYVANSGFVYPNFLPGVVSAINIADFSVSDIPVGLNPQALDLDSQGNLIVACTGNFVDISSQVNIIDTSADTVSHVDSLNAFITFVAVNSVDKAYLATFGSGVLVYDIPNRQFELDETSALPGGPGLAIDSQDNVYIADFSTDTLMIFSSTHELQNSFLVGAGPNSVALFESDPTAISPVADRVPASFTLYQNYPNPFNPETIIRFDVKTSGKVKLNIFNVLGQVVATPVNEFLTAGSYELTWDAVDFSGKKLPSGAYFYEIRTDNASAVKKMLITR